MHLVRIKTIVTAGVMVFLCGGFALAVAVRLSDSDNDRDNVARERGGVFLGIEGVILQNGRNDCGPAALRMVLEGFGKSAPLNNFEKTTDSNQNGWSMFELKELADKCGLQSAGWRMDLRGLVKSHLPLILFVENRHFVVVDSVDCHGFVFLRDPAIGRMKIFGRALGKMWKGEALVFGEKTMPRDSL